MLFVAHADLRPALQSHAVATQRVVQLILPAACGDQLREIARLIDSGIVRPVVDRVFPFESTNEAMAYVEKGRAKGKVVVKVR